MVIKFINIMDIIKVNEIIKQYKEKFNYINQKEIYKWQAVKCFQENWDIDSPDFLQMLNLSLQSTHNLLDSRNYYPKKMLIKNAELNPEVIRNLFKELYNEEINIEERIEKFHSSIKELNRENFKNEQSYQDLRAIMVYLCLKYPDRYYFYKFDVLKKFIEIIDYPYKPKMGRIENILEYIKICDNLKDVISKDIELLELHKTRLTDKEFDDKSLNILTQDVIYASVIHLGNNFYNSKQKRANERLILVHKNIKSITDKMHRKSKFVDYIENEKVNKEIGEEGEILVLQYEQEKLKSLGINKQPIHKSKTEGDGLGYDILSYDENGNEIFIEVKTTTDKYQTPFYVTQNELKFSQEHGSNYFLYRLFEFDKKKETAKYFIHQGELTELCCNPIVYKVIIKETD